MSLFKNCDKCNRRFSKLFRCRYDNKKNWEFLCQSCLTNIKKIYSSNYQYGGTKKLGK